jgi:hypothetical protein
MRTTDLLVPNRRVEKSKALQVSHLQLWRTLKPALSWSTRSTTQLQEHARSNVTMSFLLKSVASSFGGRQIEKGWSDFEWYPFILGH